MNRARPFYELYVSAAVLFIVVGVLSDSSLPTPAKGLDGHIQKHGQSLETRSPNQQDLMQEQVAAGQRFLLYQRRFSSMPMTYRFEASPSSESDSLSGTVEIHRSAWIFSKDPYTQSLKHTNSIEAGFWDTFLSIYVIPDSDTNISFERKPSRSFTWVIVLALLIVVAAVSVFFFRT